IRDSEGTALVKTTQTQIKATPRFLEPGNGRHRRARRSCRAQLAAVLSEVRAVQLTAAPVPPRPAKQIARAARHEATRALGGCWNV
ncbi:hypothetical protein, partial [Catenulispora rubra]|uniref:hypothetical protein n=1 Tax=Catenulispora rubra TaxID=280293 RepID=UPI001E5E5C77